MSSGDAAAVRPIKPFHCGLNTAINIEWQKFRIRQNMLYHQLPHPSKSFIPNASTRSFFIKQYRIQDEHTMTCLPAPALLERELEDCEKNTLRKICVCVCPCVYMRVLSRNTHDRKSHLRRKLHNRQQRHFHSGYPHNRLQKTQNGGA